ncbi:hypothetical protein [Pseudomonas corrugata]|uniref:hypothetical protein n=1 Tax=Pseudomonas corrugata TaxID=47879 RepID=UPI003B75C381
MREHAFGIGVGGDDEVIQVLGGFRVGLAVVGLEVVVEGSLGGLVELGGVEGFVGGQWVGVRGIGCWFDHNRFSMIGAATPVRD